MATENFTTYTESDALGRLTETASRVTWTNMLAGDDQIYLYKDKGVDFFNANFNIIQTICQTASDQGGAQVILWAMANDLNDFQGLIDGGKSGLFFRVIHNQSPNTIVLHLTELDSGTIYGEVGGDGFEVTDGSIYYAKMVRDEAVGTYGTFYCYLYSDAATTVLLATMSIALHTSKKDYRYIMPVMSYDATAGTTKASSGYTEDLYIQLSTTAPSVTTQAATLVDKTTATGNGNVTALGAPIAAQHGHVWATFPISTDNPYTYYDYTENGAPSATGAFTSSITGLIQNTKYFCRAYIKNSIGTFYGAEVIFTTDSDVPKLTTGLATAIATTTALGHGNITNNGGSAVSQHGVCWGTSANPTTANSKTEEGATDALGDFSSLMTGLSANTTYHYRAYATNTSGTGYGEDRTFTTMASGIPIVTTEATINVEGSTATGRGTIVDVGGAPVTEHGHCWSTSANPTTADSKTTKGAASATGAFTSDITGLTAGTTYYIRAYATNSYGTGYGDNDIIYEVAGELKGNLAYKGEYLVYTSKSGTQRALFGTEF